MPGFTPIHSNLSNDEVINLPYGSAQGSAATIFRYSSSVKARRVSVCTFPFAPIASTSFAIVSSFGASAISTEGYESLWSPLRQDTPRPDARNVLVYPFQTDADSSGFRFWSDANSDGVGQSSELGLIQNGSRTDIDFVIHRHADSTLWVVPVFAGTSLQLYSTSPIADLTAIDFAPASGYSGDSLLARPGFGYVFEIVDGTVLHYGALRMTHVSRQYVIFDWSVQTDPGNPELVVPKKPSLTGTQVAGSR